MATLNLGRIKPVFRGAYNGATAYVVDDIVTSGGETFICILASTGNATSNATYWTKIAQKGTDGTDLTSTLTTQGDILYRDGSGLARLGYGTAGQVLQTGGSGANPSWADASSGKIVSVHYAEYLDTLQQNTTFTWYDVPNLSLTITPASVDSKFFIMMRISMGTDGNHTYARINAGGNPVHIANTAGSRFRTTSTVAAKSTWDIEELSGQYLWDANTSSAVTIKAQYAGESTHYLNRGERDNNNNYDSRAVSSLSVFEINN